MQACLPAAASRTSFRKDSLVKNFLHRLLGMGPFLKLRVKSVTHQEGEVPATRPVKGIYNGTSFSTNLQTTPGLPACNAVGQLCFSGHVSGSQRRPYGPLFGVWPWNKKGFVRLPQCVPGLKCFTLSPEANLSLLSAPPSLLPSLSPSHIELSDLEKAEENSSIRQMLMESNSFLPQMQAPWIRALEQLIPEPK